MHFLARRRAGAYALDCCTYAVVAAATVPIGLIVSRLVDAPSHGLVLAMSAVPPAIATVWAARVESGRHRATLGKRWQKLIVVPDGMRTVGERVRFGPALARNAVKIFVPWQLGHIVSIEAMYDSYAQGNPFAIGAAVVFYPMIGVFAWMLLRDEGRGPHDRIAGTRVVPAPDSSAPAP